VEQPDPLAGLAAKLDEMQREVRQHFASPATKPPPVSETEEDDSGFMDSIFSFFFGNRR
jgi:hypothetical protein